MLRGLCWKQVISSILGEDFRRLPTLNKRPLPLPLVVHGSMAKTERKRYLLVGRNQESVYCINTKNM